MKFVLGNKTKWSMHAKDHHTHTKTSDKVASPTVNKAHKSIISILIQIIPSKSCHITNLASQTRLDSWNKEKKTCKDYVSIDGNGESVFSLNVFKGTHTFSLISSSIRKEGEAAKNNLDSELPDMSIYTARPRRNWHNNETINTSIGPYLSCII